MILRRAFLLALLLAATLSQRTAHADDADEAKRSFDAGVKQLEAKDYPSAVSSFERALQLRESLPTLFNLAVAYRGVGRFKDAKAKLDTFVLGLERTNAPEEALARARILRDEVVQKLGRIYIEARGGTQAVLLDEQTIAKSDGKRMIDVDPGTYRVQVRREGYEPMEERILVAEGRTYNVSLDAAAKPLFARISIEAQPASAEIRIDSRVVASGRYEGALAYGSYVVEVLAPDYVPRAERVLVQSTEEVALNIALEAADRPLTSEWWFWTGIVAVVAAGTVTTIALTSRGPGRSCGTTGLCLFDD